MRIRRLLLASGAVVAAGALALAPSASTNTPTGGAIAEIVVGGSPDATRTAHAVTLTTTSASIGVSVYGFPLILTCTGGAAGVVYGGPFANPAMVLDHLALTCPSVFEQMEAGCDIDIDYNTSAAENVHVGLVDYGTTAKFNRVSGTVATFGAVFANCVLVTNSNGCTFTVGGKANAAFDEYVKLNGHQELHLNGTNTLRINNVVNCLGAVSNNQAFTLNAVFDVDSVDNAIDFQN